LTAVATTAMATGAVMMIGVVMTGAMISVAMIGVMMIDVVMNLIVMTGVMTGAVMTGAMIGVVMSRAVMIGVMIGATMISVAMSRAVTRVVGAVGATAPLPLLLMCAVRYARFMVTLPVTAGGAMVMVLMMKWIKMSRRCMLLPMLLTPTGTLIPAPQTASLEL
jgi:hypothetical protein